MPHITPTPGDPQITLSEKFPSLLGPSGKLKGQVCPSPNWKHSRQRSRAAMQRCRSKNRCEFPACKSPVHAQFNPIDPHHAQTRGAGGDDSDANLVALCRRHHDAVHRDPEANAVVALIVERRAV
jgi:hypothetical protein